jgi:hypothetical protein
VCSKSAGKIFVTSPKRRGYAREKKVAAMTTPYTINGAAEIGDTGESVRLYGNVSLPDTTTSTHRILSTTTDGTIVATNFSFVNSVLVNSGATIGPLLVGRGNVISADATKMVTVSMAQGDVLTNNAAGDLVPCGGSKTLGNTLTIDASGDASWVDTDAALLAADNTWTGANSWTQPLRAVSGTAALPGYSFTDNADLGMYRSGANSLAFTSMGSHKMTITPNFISLGSGAQLRSLASVASSPRYSFTGSTGTGLYSPGDSSLGMSSEGVSRMILSSAGVNVQNHKIFNVATPTVAADATTKAYVDAEVAGAITMVRAANNTWTGSNIFTGGLAAGNLPITAVATPTAATDAANRDYVDTEIADAVMDANTALLAANNTWTGANTFTGGLDAGALPITSVGAPTLAAHATTKTYVDDEVAAAAAQAIIDANNTIRAANNTWTGTNMFTGGLDAGSLPITSVGMPILAAHATTKSYVDTEVAGAIIDANNTIRADNNTWTGTNSFTGGLAAGTLPITDVGAPVNPTDAATMDYVDTEVAGAIIDANNIIRAANNTWTGSNSFTGGLAAGTLPITSVGAPINPTDAATMNYVDTEVAGAIIDANNTIRAANNTWTGTNTFAGGLDAGSLPITSVGAPTLAAHATTKTYVDDKVAAAASQAIIDANNTIRAANNTWTGTNAFTGGLAAGTLPITSVGAPVNPTDAATMNYVDTEVAQSIIDANNTIRAANNTWTGSNSFTGGLAAGTLPITSVGAPVNPTDAATMDYVDTEVSAASASLLAANNTWTGTNSYTQAAGFANGSVGAPSISFAGDTNTGIYLRNPNEIGVATGGGQRLVISNTAITFNNTLTGRNVGTSLQLMPDNATGTNHGRIVFRSSLGAARGEIDVASSDNAMRFRAGPTGTSAFIGLMNDLTINMNSRRVTNAASPTDVSDLTRKDYVDAISPDLLAANNTWTGSNSFTGGLAAGTLPITSVGAPVNPTDAATMGYVDTEIAAETASLLAASNTWTGANSFTAGLAAGTLPITSVGAPVNPTDAATMDYVDTEVTAAATQAIIDANDTIRAANNTWTGSNTFTQSILVTDQYFGNGPYSPTTPTYSFADDQNTGMYRGGSGRIRFATNGTIAVDFNTSTVDLSRPLTMGSNAITGASLLRSGDGALTTPVYSFASDTNTGMYRGGSGRMRFATSGVLAFDINGNTVDVLRPLTMGSNQISGVSRILSEAGTVALPAYSFASDTNTGLFWKTNDTIAISTGAVESVVFGNGGAGGNNRFLYPVEGGNGTVTAPSFSFINDKDTGVYWGGSGSLRMTTDGSLAADVNATSIDFSRPLTMGANRIMNMSDPGAAQDAATKAYVDSIAPSGPVANWHSIDIVAPDTNFDGMTPVELASFTLGSGGQDILAFVEFDIWAEQSNATIVFISTDGPPLTLPVTSSMVAQTIIFDHNGRGWGNVRMSAVLTAGNLYHIFFVRSGGSHTTLAYTRDPYSFIGDDLNPIIIRWARADAGTDSDADHTWTGENIYTQPVAFADGTVTEPSITFAADTDTGIYREDDDTLAVTTNGVQRLAIGTDNATFTNQVLVTGGSSVAPGLALSTWPSSGIRIASSFIQLVVNGVVRGQFSGAIFETTASIQLGGVVQSNTNGSAAVPTYTFAGSGIGMYAAGNDLVFSTLSTERLRISNSQITLASQRITNVANPVDPQDAATKAYVDIGDATTMWFTNSILPPLTNYNGTTAVELATFSLGSAGQAFMAFIHFTVRTQATNASIVFITSNTGLLIAPYTGLNAHTHIFDNNGTGSATCFLSGLFAGATTYRIMIRGSGGTYTGPAYQPDLYPSIIANINPIIIRSMRTQ